jgi:hypothetical protein
MPLFWMTLASWREFTKFILAQDGASEYPPLLTGAILRREIGWRDALTAKSFA